MSRLESIKHKGKRIDNGEWVYGFYANGLIDLDGDKEIYRHFIIVWDINGYFTDYAVDPETVCHDNVILQRLERYREALEYSTVYLEEITSKFNLTTSLHSDSLKRIRLNKEALKE